MLQGIRYINKHMEVALKGVDEKVSTLDCTDLFMSEDGQSLSKDLWRTDLLHHNDQGMLWPPYSKNICRDARCTVDAVNQHLQ